jgi:nitrile hydratase
MAAMAEMGNPFHDGRLAAIANMPEVHNLVVCTLCSCYPRNLLGQPPGWYVSKAYRSRAVREPRAVLAEFGVNLPADVQVRVHDSTAELRYLIVPMRPAGTEGLDADALAALVTRDCMIGTGLPKVPD